jgi:RNA polymerase sigma-70 factor (ECF subfamily)
MAGDDCDTTGLIRRAASGDGAAGEQLLNRHRDRLRRMVAVRLDRRVAARVDPSDVVQEALGEAAQKLPRYLRDPKVAFYPWLRRIAALRLLQIHRRHIQVKKRTVRAEEPPYVPLPDESVSDLADRLAASGTSPSDRVSQREQRDRVRAALAALADRDREILVMMYLEQLTSQEIAEVLGITSDAVRMRHMRALRRIRQLLEE